MKKLILVALLAMAAITTGCTQSAPGCSDERTVGSVVKIIKDKIGLSAQSAEQQQQLKLTIDAIRTVKSDKGTGAQTCEGDLLMTSDKTGQVKIPIEFKSELTDKKEHYVSYREK
jgi:hypothetical protein